MEHLQKRWRAAVAGRWPTARERQISRSSRGRGILPCATYCRALHTAVRYTTYYIYILHTTYCRALHTAVRYTTYYILHTTYYILHTTYYILPCATYCTPCAASRTVATRRPGRGFVSGPTSLHRSGQVSGTLCLPVLWPDANAVSWSSRFLCRLRCAVLGKGRGKGERGTDRSSASRRVRQHSG